MKFINNIVNRFKIFKHTHPRFSKSIDFLTSKTFARVAGIVGSVVTLAVASVITGGGLPLVLAGIGLLLTVGAAIFGVAMQTKTLRNLNKLQETRNTLIDLIEIDEKLLAHNIDIGSVVNSSVDLNKRDKKYAVNPPSLSRSAAKNFIDNLAENASSIAISAATISIPGIIFSSLSAIANTISGTNEKHKFEHGKWEIKKDIDKFNEHINNFKGLSSLKDELIKKQILFNKIEQTKNINNHELGNDELKNYVENEFNKVKESENKKFSYVKILFKDIGTVLNPFNKNFVTFKLYKIKDPQATITSKIDVKVIIHNNNPSLLRGLSNAHIELDSDIHHSKPLLNQSKKVNSVRNK